jgi:anaerobic magnesium-protoporphyrin IX monomethyl ester cyclase
VSMVNLNLMSVSGSRFPDRENYTPLGPLYIAASLEKDGVNVEFIDYQLFRQSRSFDPALFARALGQTAPIVGLSCMSNLLPFSILLAGEIKTLAPETVVVLGGVGPSPVREEILSAFPFVDIVVEGEGEISMGEIARGSRDAAPPHRLVADLDTLPLPAYSLLDFRSYVPARSMITSRGCPHRCTFCTEPHNFGGIARLRSVASVVEEIELLHSLHPHTTFLFQDDMLPVSRPRFHELLSAFRALSFPITWKCFSRIDLMDADLMLEMAKSGCVQVRYGVESGSNATLERIGKSFTIEQAHQTVVASLDYFPSVHASFMWGFPFEDWQGFEDTLSWVERFEAAGVSVLLFEFSPLPGSRLYHEFRDGLRFSPEAYSSFVVTGHEVVRGDGSYLATTASEPMYRLIRDHPDIFPGFYHYPRTEELRQRQRLTHLKASGRTPRRNEYDS